MTSKRSVTKTKQWMIAAPGAAEWHKSETKGGVFTNWIAVERDRIWLRHGAACPNVT